VGLLLGTLAACGSSDDTNTSTGPGLQKVLFSSSACKKDTAARQMMAHRYGLLAIDSEAGLDGLRCVAWQRVAADEVKIDLYNFDDACGATWAGDSALTANGTLELHIDNPSCRVASCGKCMYDWSFDIHGKMTADQAMPVAIAIDTCKAQQSTKLMSASLGSEAKGIHCTLADYGALAWQAASAGTCGKLGMPCTGSLLCGTGGFTSTGTCDTGLTCDSSAADNEPVCLLPCTNDDDCPRTDVWSCQAGLCRPKG
jgi:hypothetical protein